MKRTAVTPPRLASLPLLCLQWNSTRFSNASHSGTAPSLPTAQWSLHCQLLRLLVMPHSCLAGPRPAAVTWQLAGSCGARCQMPCLHCRLERHGTGSHGTGIPASGPHGPPRLQPIQCCRFSQHLLRLLTAKACACRLLAAIASPVLPTIRWSATACRLVGATACRDGGSKPSCWLHCNPGCVILSPHTLPCCR